MSSVPENTGTEPANCPPNMCSPPSTLCSYFRERVPLQSSQKNPTQLPAPHSSPGVAVKLVLIYVGTHPDQDFLEAGHLRSSFCWLRTPRSQRMAEQMERTWVSDVAYGRKSPWDLPPCIGWLHVQEQTPMQLKLRDFIALIPTIGYITQFQHKHYSLPKITITTF